MVPNLTHHLNDYHNSLYFKRKYLIFKITDTFIEESVNQSVQLLSHV